MNKLQGFTLPELLVSVAIAAILLAAALPSMKEVIVKDRTASQVNELLASLQLARSEAVKRMTPVTVCASADGESCLSSAEKTWENGWIVFNESVSANGKRDLGEGLLRVGGAMKSGYTLRSNNKISGYITYLANGRSQTADASNAVGQMVLCAESDAANLHAVLLALSGRFYSSKDSNGDGHMDDGLGNELLACNP